MDTKSIRKQRKTTYLTQKELAVLRTNSKLSDKEIKICYEGFIQMCPSGKLDQDRFINVCKQFDPDTDTEICASVFKNMDQNSDGTVDFNEYLFATAVNNFRGDLDHRLEFIFDFWDISEDGQLDQNELGHLISAMYDRARVKDRHGEKDPHKRAKEMIDKLDINGDKKVSKEEFIKGCKNDEIIAKLLAPNL
ncbi:hypothetical protein I4U23_015736 [Adineta vaga]|nr:hypothetical protein I4U23_015736 [Adineta vaga]